MCPILATPKCLWLFRGLSLSFCSQETDAPKIRDEAILCCGSMCKCPTPQCRKLAAHISERIGRKSRVFFFSWWLWTSWTEFGLQMHSRELPAYLSLNRLLNGILSYSWCYFVQICPISWRFNSCVTDGPTDEQTDGPTDRRTDIPSYRDARTLLEIKYAHVEVCHCACMLTCKCTSMPMCNYASVQLCQFASMPICKYANVQVCQYASMLMCKYADVQVCQCQFFILSKRRMCYVWSCVRLP